MNILIIGGRKKADFLLSSFVDKKINVTLIHDDYDYCIKLSAKYPATIICGDGTKAYILEESNIRHMDIVIAMTPRDADNLVICEMAKKLYNVGKTFAIVGNPKNVEVFKRLGVDTVLSATYMITDIIEQIATVNTLNSYIPIENGAVALMEFTVQEEFSICNKTLNDIKLPEKSIVGMIIRGANSIIPKGNTRILKNDKLVILSVPTLQKEIFKILSGSLSWH